MRTRMSLQGWHSPAVMVAVLVLMLLVGMPTAGAYQPPGRTVRASLTSGGIEAVGESEEPAISANGRFVAFASDASNLVPGDSNEHTDIFVHDVVTGITERVSVSSDGDESNSESLQPAINADGRFVAFSSYATTLAPGTGALQGHVYVHNRATHETIRVSVSGTRAEGNGQSEAPSISADGQSVSFRSSASNLVAGDMNGTTDHFVHDLDTGVTERVNVSSDEEQVTLPYFADQTSVSADGRYVAFATNSPLVPEDISGLPDVYLRDREAGTTERVSVASDGMEGDLTSTEPVISSDGRYVLFVSSSGNLVPGDTDFFAFDVFVRDRHTGITEMVSVNSAGEEANDHSFGATLSPDGRFAAFRSWASNLAPGGDDSHTEVYLHDRELGLTTRAVLGWDGQPPLGDALEPSLSEGGRVLAFTSGAPNVVKRDRNFTKDVFVTEVGPAVGIGDLAATAAGGEVRVSGWARLSGTGLSSASDPSMDGEVPSAAGTELVGAALAVRPEVGDLLVRLDLASLPGRIPWPIGPSVVVASNQAGAPATVYGLDLSAVGVGDVEVRVSLRPHPGWGLYPVFTLFACEIICEEVGVLRGGFGTTGDQVRVAMPLSALGLEPDAAIIGLRAWTAAGVAEGGSAALLDEVALPNAAASDPHVDLGIAPAGTPPDEVAFTLRAQVGGGEFEETLDADGLTPGAYDVWARACVGSECSSRRAEVTL